MSVAWTASPPSPPGPTARPPRRRRRLLLLSLSGLVASLGCYTWWTHTHPVLLTASVEINAAPERVWAVLTDFGAYPQWNPFVTRAEITSTDGRLRPGATMRNRMEQDGKASTFTPEVLVARPGRELRWLGRVGPGWLVDAEHRFVIERTGPGTVRLTQSESFTGSLVPFVEKGLKHGTLPQFQAMNEALKKRVTAQAR